MKLLQTASVSALVLLFGTGVYAFQRTADFGFTDDTPESYRVAEFAWSRLRYNSSMSSYSRGSFAYGGYGFGRGGAWSRGLSEG